MSDKQTTGSAYRSVWKTEGADIVCNVISVVYNPRLNKVGLGLWSRHVDLFQLCFVFAINEIYNDVHSIWHSDWLAYGNRIMNVLVI